LYTYKGKGSVETGSRSRQAPERYLATDTSPHRIDERYLTKDTVADERDLTGDTVADERDPTGDTVPHECHLTAVDSHHSYLTTDTTRDLPQPPEA